MKRRPNTTPLLALILVGLTVTLQAQRSGNRIVIMTDEFQSVRRIVVALPEHYRTIPQVSSQADSGQFTILVKNVDTADFYSRKYIRATGAVPLKLVTTFPDSQTIQINGYTQPFLRLVSYILLNENKLIFDIYNHRPVESYFHEKTIPFEEKDVFYRNENEGTYPVPDHTRHRGDYSVFPSYVVMGVLAVLLLAVIGVIIWKRYRSVGEKETEPPSEQEPEPIPEKDPAPEPDDHEKQVRKVMRERGLTYDEANLFIHVTRRK